MLGAGLDSARAAGEQEIKVGINLLLTGADAEGVTRIKYGALFALKQANDCNAVPGYRLVPWVLNHATSTAGPYDPAQAATNARKFVADPAILAGIGPQKSGSGKAMAPILSVAGLATITPASTNPDTTDPKFASQFAPGGKAVYFRTVTTDAYQGPAMTNFFSDVLKVSAVFVLDDSGTYPVGIADAFSVRAKEKGIKMLGRERLNPLQADYTVGLTKVKALNPEGICYGGVMGAGARLVKQSYGILSEKMPKGGGDGLLAPEMLTSVWFPAAEGWDCTIASPHLTKIRWCSRSSGPTRRPGIRSRTTMRSRPITQDW